MNEIQYVYDAGGNKKSVIVPIELWEKTLQLQNSRSGPCNPQEYYGVYRDLIKDPKGVAESLRETGSGDWTKDRKKFLEKDPEKVIQSITRRRKTGPVS